MNEETLLSLLTGGKFGTSDDLPTIPEAAHSYIDQVTASFEESRQEPQQVVGTGLGLLDMTGGFSKAGAMIPTGTEKFQQLIKMLGKSKGDEILYNNTLQKLLQDIQRIGIPKDDTMRNLKNIRRGMK